MQSLCVSGHELRICQSFHPLGGHSSSLVCRSGAGNYRISLAPYPGEKAPCFRCLTPQKPFDLYAYCGKTNHILYTPSALTSILAS